MKILLYSLNYAPEPVGIGKYSGELAEWLANHGHRVRVITAPPYFPEWVAIENRYRSEQRGGVLVLRCPLWVPRRPNGLTRLLHLASFAISSLPIVLAQLVWRPDVVMTVAPAFFCAPGGLLLAKLSGKLTTSWLHIQDFELDAAFELGLLKGRLARSLAEGWERSILLRFDRVSTISETMLQRVFTKGVDTGKGTLLPNWVDLEAVKPHQSDQQPLNPYRQELGIPPDSCVLLYSGSMNQKQGLDLIVDVIDDLRDLTKIVWLLAGEGPTKSTLIKKLKGRKNAFILPLQPISRLNDWLNLADIHLLPQKGNAADLVLPSKLIGILASGKCLVASSPANSELGKLAEQAGIRVEPEDRAGFGAAIRLLAGNEDKRVKFGRKAREIAVKYFGKEAVLERLEAQLQSQKYRSMETH